MDLQLPIRQVPITTNVVSSNPAQVKSTRYNIIRSILSVVFSEYTDFVTNKTDHHNIAEILLKMALNTITHKPRF